MSVEKKRSNVGRLLPDQLFMKKHNSLYLIFNYVMKINLIGNVFWINVQQQLNKVLNILFEFNFYYFQVELELKLSHWFVKNHH